MKDYIVWFMSLAGGRHFTSPQEVRATSMNEAIEITFNEGNFNLNSIEMTYCTEPIFVQTFEPAIIFTAQGMMK